LKAFLCIDMDSRQYPSFQYCKNTLYKKTSNILYNTVINSKWLTWCLDKSIHHMTQGWVTLYRGKASNTCFMKEDSLFKLFSSTFVHNASLIFFLSAIFIIGLMFFSSKLPLWSFIFYAWFSIFLLPLLTSFFFTLFKYFFSFILPL